MYDNVTLLVFAIVPTILGFSITWMVDRLTKVYTRKYPKPRNRFK